MRLPAVHGKHEGSGRITVRDRTRNLEQWRSTAILAKHRNRAGIDVQATRSSRNRNECMLTVAVAEANIGFAASKLLQSTGPLRRHSPLDSDLLQSMVLELSATQSQ